MSGVVTSTYALRATYPLLVHIIYYITTTYIHNHYTVGMYVRTYYYVYIRYEVDFDIL